MLPALFQLLVFGVVVAGVPGALIGGAMLGKNLNPRLPRGPSWLLPWLTATFAGYLFAASWAIVPVLAHGDERATNQIKVRGPGPAHDAGLRSGDRVVSVDGRVTPGWDDVRGAIASAAPGQSLDFAIDRDGSRIRSAVTPIAGRIGVETIMERRAWSAPAAALRIIAMPARMIAGTFSSLFQAAAGTGSISVQAMPTNSPKLTVFLMGAYWSSLWLVVGSIGYLFVALARSARRVSA